MALNGKVTSCQDIIREIMRDCKYKIELPWQDSVEWVTDAIELIGAPMALTDKQECITIEDYRGILPCDLSVIEQAAGSFNGCTPFAMTYSTNSFHPVKFCEDTEINPLLIAQANIVQSEDPIGEDISGNPVYTFQNGNMSLPETITDTSNNTVVNNYPTYTVNNNFIFTNFQTGYVFLSYRALPVDSDGMPTIPDNRRYKEGVKSYLRYKIDYILWRTGQIGKDVYEESKVEWMFNVGSAGNAARMPSLDKMQALMNQIRLIPKKYAHNSFFRALGN